MKHWDPRRLCVFLKALQELWVQATFHDDNHAVVVVVVE